MQVQERMRLDVPSALHRRLTTDTKLTATTRAQVNLGMGAALLSEAIEFAAKWRA